MSENTSARIQSELSEGILTVTFNRPEKKNAFTIAMYEDLVAALERAGTDDAVRVIVLTGAGGAFTSGNDLGDFLNAPPAGEDSPVFRFLLALVGLDKPVIAAVPGLAVGIGTTMLLHCDLVYAASTAKFVLPFVNLALVPEGASTYLLPRLAGPHRSAELLFFGEPFDAGTAKEVGLVNQVVEPDALASLTTDRARTLAKKPLGALRKTKELVRTGTRDLVREALSREGIAFMQRLASPEAREAFQAFLEKRPPDFTKLS